MGKRIVDEMVTIKARYFDLMADFDYRQLDMTEQHKHLVDEGFELSYQTVRRWYCELKEKHAEEWLEASKKKISFKSICVDDALFEKARKGDVEAIKTWYAKNENWSQKQVSEITTVNPETRGQSDEELRLAAAQGLQRAQLEKIIKEKGLTIVEPGEASGGIV